MPTPILDYDDIALIAKELIEGTGRLVTFTELSETPDDALKPWGPRDESVDSNIELYGTFVPPNTVREFGITSLGEGTDFQDMITFSQQIIILFPQQYDLRDYTKVIDRSQTWKITAMQVLRPADVALLAFVGVRR